MDTKPHASNQITDLFRRYDRSGEGAIARQDLATLLATLGLDGGADLDLLLGNVAKDRNGKVLYTDFVDKVFSVQVPALIMAEQVSIHAASPGDEVSVPLSSQEGTVTQRTTTDVQVRLPDGNEVWFEIEDVAGGPVVIHEVSQGGKVKVRGGDRCEVIERNTGEIKLRLPDGTEAWHIVEDLEEEADQSPHHVQPGSKVATRATTLRAIVKERTTTDAVVVLPNGVTASYGIEDLAPTAVAPSEEALTRLRQIFEQCDTSKDGLINKRELIKICRKDESIASFFGLSQNIRQEDGTRDSMERLFQSVDVDSDRQLSWGEFRAFFLDCVTGRTAPAALANGTQAALTDAKRAW